MDSHLDLLRGARPSIISMQCSFVDHLPLMRWLSDLTHRFRLVVPGSSAFLHCIVPIQHSNLTPSTRFRILRTLPFSSSLPRRHQLALGFICRYYPLHWRGVNIKYHHGSCPDSYAGTITRLRNRQLEGEKEIRFLCRSLVRSQCHITEAYAENQPIFHHKLPMHGIAPVF